MENVNLTQSHGPCLCGHSGHRYRDCHALNPYSRRQMWDMRQPMINRINRQLRRSPGLRRYILSLGYEYYPRDIQPTPIPRNPLAQLSELPVELTERIMEWTYAISVEAQPSSHPLINNKPSYETIHIGGPVPTVLNLRTPNVRGRARERWLSLHPGNWGPLFEVMYASKQLYAIGKSIRYRQVNIQGADPRHGIPSWGHDMICH